MLLRRIADALRHRGRLRRWNADAALGRRGEDLAHRYLQGLGYRVVARNWRGRSGEVDIIAFDRERLVFVEVKSRSSAEFGSPERAIGEEKRQALARAAREYTRRSGIAPERLRFDVVTVLLAARPQIEHYPDTFHLSV